MKRIIGIVVCLATVGAGLYLGTKVWAQQQPQQQGYAPLRTRIALVNLGQVIKNYQKFKNFEETLRGESQEAQKFYDSKKNQVVALQGDLAKPNLDASARENTEKQVRQIQREMQDYGEDIKQKLAKREFDQLVQTYKEVKEAVEVFARSNDIELVMQYSDLPGSDAYLPAVFQRKLANNACTPMYVDPRMEITDQIIRMLNQRMAGFSPQSNN